MYNLHLFFIGLQAAYRILLPALGPLHRGIHRFPLELLVRALLVEDCPASERSNLKCTRSKELRVNTGIFLRCPHRNAEGNLSPSNIPRP